VPFDFLKKKPPAAASTPGPPADEVPKVAEGTAFDGLTEEWRLVGTMQL
jgi:hypothetical protein